MSIARTSRTQLLDQVVRVDRRLRPDDGMYGTYQQWVTIIPRFWVRIYPDQHPERAKIDLGEMQLDSRFRAIADLTRNGMTIMTTDRFIDEKNNEVYDITGIVRPRHRSPYNAMTQFSLRIVKDERVHGS